MNVTCPCDLCYQTKCSYVPPYPWALDFPHLMLRGKAIAEEEKNKSLKQRARDSVLTSTDRLKKLMKLPLRDIIYKAISSSPSARKVASKLTGVHAKAPSIDFYRLFLLSGDFDFFLLDYMVFLLFQDIKDRSNEMREMGFEEDYDGL